MESEAYHCKIRKLILVTGMPGSGKSVLGRIAREKGIPVINMGDIVREVAKEKGLEVIDANLAAVAAELREKYGREALAVIAYKRACEAGSEVAVIEGLRSLEELDYLRRAVEESFLIAFHASPRTRFERLVARGRGDDPGSFSEFEERDRRELKLGIGSVIALADVMIVNEGVDLEELENIVENVLKRILGG